MIAAPQKMHREFLKVIAHISKLFKNEELRTALLEAPSPSVLYETLIDAERRFLQAQGND